MKIKGQAIRLLIKGAIVSSGVLWRLEIRDVKGKLAVLTYALSREFNNKQLSVLEFTGPDDGGETALGMIEATLKLWESK